VEIDFEFDEEQQDPVALPTPILKIAEKKEALTDQEFKAEQNDKANYAIAMERAEEVFTRLEGEGFRPEAAYLDAVVAALIPGEPSIEKLALSDNYVAYEAAKLLWLNQVVRDVTGAQIAAGEVDREGFAFFPSLFDPPESVANKRKARRERLLAIKEAAGGAYDAIKQEQNSQLYNALRERYKASTSETEKKRIEDKFKRAGVKL
jgi:hypothetical protein|tara:strand:+ start:820 stop:1437 length:618 start_codon:yes stop_codon:yes gene_type:complete